MSIIISNYTWRLRLLYLGFHRKMEEFVFDSFVNKGLSNTEMVSEFPSFKKRFDGLINEGFFSRDYCNTFMSELRSRMVKESASRKLGFSKEKDFRTTIIKRFAKNRSSWAFLPQENIAKVWGCSQRTVSRYLKKMVEEGYLVLDKKHNRLAHKAAEYRLANLGLKLLREVTGRVVDMAEKAIATIKEVLTTNGPVENEEQIEIERTKNRKEWREYNKKMGYQDPFPPKPPSPEIPF